MGRMRAGAPACSPIPFLSSLGLTLPIIPCRCGCLQPKPEDRPSFAEVASKMGDARQAKGGAAAKWLTGS